MHGVFNPHPYAAVAHLALHPAGGEVAANHRPAEDHSCVGGQGCQGSSPAGIHGSPKALGAAQRRECVGALVRELEVGHVVDCVKAVSGVEGCPCSNITWQGPFGMGPAATEDDGPELRSHFVTLWVPK